jgi:predicted nucleotidyltransferase
MISYLEREVLSRKCSTKLKDHIPLSKTYLFGSTARNEDKISSNIDICLIGAKKLTKKNKELIEEITAQIYITTCITINWIYFTLKEWKKGIHPIIKTIKQEGKLLWEKKRTV